MEFPSIMLAGREWPVKPLVIRQMRVVAPAFQRIAKMDVKSVTTENVDDLAEIAYQAVCPAQDCLKRDDFMNLPVTLAELLGALHVIGTQAGMVRGESSGEAPGQTGTE